MSPLIITLDPASMMVGAVLLLCLQVGVALAGVTVMAVRQVRAKRIPRVTQPTLVMPPPPPPGPGHR